MVVGLFGRDASSFIGGWLVEWREGERRQELQAPLKLTAAMTSRFWGGGLMKIRPGVSRLRESIKAAVGLTWQAFYGSYVKEQKNIGGNQRKTDTGRPSLHSKFYLERLELKSFKWTSTLCCLFFSVFLCFSSLVRLPPARLPPFFRPLISPPLSPPAACFSPCSPLMAPPLCSPPHLWLTDSKTSHCRAC